jgi:PAS domain S-box-containing protein
MQQQVTIPLAESLLQSLEEAVFMVDGSAKLVYANPAAQELLAPLWGEEKQLLQTLSNADAAAVSGFLVSKQAAFDQLVKLKLEQTTLSRYWLRLRLVENGYWSGTLRPLVTKQAENDALGAMQARLDQFETWLNETAEALQVADETGKLLFVNQVSCKRIGRSFESLVGKHISEIEKTFEDPQVWENHLAELKKQGNLLVQGFHKRADGSSFPVEASVKYLEYNGQGYVLAYIIDISERVAQSNQLHAYMQALEHSNRELDQFAYVVSHDLKSPLRGINNLSNWLEEDLGDALQGDSKKHMELLRGRVKRLEALIDGILAYSRAGRSNARLEWVSLPQFITELKADFSLQWPQASWSIEGPALQLFTEKVTLYQVLSNLISNALKHGDKPDIQLQLHWKPDAGRLHFSVIDDGPGIAARFHDKIFRIFQTLQARDTRENTGVGLAIVKKIIEEKGGQIRLESDEGKGAAFYFDWPMQENEVPK